MTEVLDSASRPIRTSTESQVSANGTHLAAPGQSSSDEIAARQAFSRYEASWDLAHLDTAINFLQRAIDDSSQLDAGLLGKLGAWLSKRYEWVGDLHTLERAIIAQQSALELTPEDYSDRSGRLSDLGVSLRDRFRLIGELDDIERAIAMHRRAVELAPNDHPDMPVFLDNLGISLGIRYEHSGDLEDLERAIQEQQRAIAIAPPRNHPNGSSRLNNLARNMRIRFERLGGLDDLEHAITLQQRAVELTPNGHSDMSALLDNLGYAQDLRYQRLGDINDLELAIATRRRTIELTPDGHPELPTRLNNLGVSLCTRYICLNDSKDLDSAIGMQQRAVELTPNGHLSLPSRTCNLGSLRYLRYRHFSEAADLEGAIILQRQALEITQDGDLAKPIRFKNLGHSLAARFRVNKVSEDFREAVSCFIAATARPLGPPSLRLASAEFLVKLLSEHSELNTPKALLDAHSRTIDMIPEIIWLGHGIERRLEEARRCGLLVTSAVRAAIGVSNPLQALEWLEAGRSFIWSQVLSLRTPVDDLEEQDPALAQSLKSIHAQLQVSVHTPSISEGTASRNTYDGSPANAEASHHRKLVIEYENVLADARRRPGFEDFLRPKKLSTLLPSSAVLNGIVVFLNVDKDHCDALILREEGSITAVTLPKLSLDKAEKLRSGWQSYLKGQNVRERGRAVVQYPHSSSETFATRILDRIWHWIVRPVLRALGLNDVKPNCNRLLHVTWCPTGPLTQLPLHAAGVYEEKSGPRIYDFVISSYTPSLSTLMHHLDTSGSRAPEPGVLVVTQPATPGLPRLPGTSFEKERLQTAFAESQFAFSTLEGTEASVDAVSAVLDQHSWLHMACHGCQDLNDPMKSAFALYDGPLSLANLMGTTSDKAELAFLSACQTAVGDEKIPEESMHLAAGMLAVGYKGVIATMWSIRDDDAPLVVEAYYRKLLELRASSMLGKGETGAAYALHEATKQLRQMVGEMEVVRWATFVHFGI